MSSTDYPRVLVLNGGPFNRSDNHGIVMSGFFDGWPKDRLACIYLTQNAKPDFDVCTQTWAIRRRDIWMGMIGRAGSGEIQPASSTSLRQPDRLPDESINPYDCRTRFERSLGRVFSDRLRLYLNEATFHLPPVLSPPLLRWIEKFQPDVLFSMLGSVALLRLNAIVCRKFRIPLVPYITDDWITSLHAESTLLLPLRIVKHRWFHDCLNCSPLRICCSDEMAKEYRRRYHGRFEPVLYAVKEPDAFDPYRGETGASPLRLVFTGYLKPDRWRSLRQIGEALADLNDEGVAGCLEIYSYPEDLKALEADLTLPPVMRPAGFVGYADLPALLQTADLLVHVESFDPAVIPRTRYSLSTKIPHYMLAGRCILGYGPGDVASMRHIENSKAGMVVGVQDPALLRDTLADLISNAALRTRLAHQGFKVAQERHLLAVQHKSMRRLLVEASRNG